MKMQQAKGRVAILVGSAYSYSDLRKKFSIIQGRNRWRYCFHQRL